MIFKLRDFVFYPIAIKKFHNFLKESQYWKLNKRRGWIQEKLNNTLQHAVKNVPYYRKTLAKFQSDFNWMIDNLDLSPLPILTKEDIRKYKTDLYATNHQQYKSNKTHTSGSTGTPTEFLLDRGSNVSHFASIWRVLNWTGYHFGNRFADMTGFIPKNSNLFQYDFRLNCLHLSSFNFKKENMRFYVEKIKKFKPVLIKAYPSTIDLFCRWIKDEGLNVYQPKAVLTCAETLLEHQKDNIKSVLKCPVYDFYNQNERAALISTCEQEKYHVHEEYSFTEFCQTGYLEDNSTTAILATSFHNYAMPLIRYQTNDLAAVSNNNFCDCGRTYRYLQNIIGRVEDIVVTPDGRYVGRLDAAFLYSPGVRQSQIVQETEDSIQVNIVKADHFSKRDLDTIEKELHIRLGEEIKIDFHFVDHILPGINGKVKFVISKPGKEIFRDDSRNS